MSSTTLFTQIALVNWVANGWFDVMIAFNISLPVDTASSMRTANSLGRDLG